MFLMVSLFSTMANVGCQSTNEVLTRKEPEKYLEVIPADPSVDVEASLKASGQKYVCKEIYAGKGSPENRRACFVKAPEESKYKKLGVKLSQLPEAILIDTGRNVLVIGEIVLYSVVSGGIVP